MHDPEPPAPQDDDCCPKGREIKGYSERQFFQNKRSFVGIQQFKIESIEWAGIDLTCFSGLPSRGQSVLPDHPGGGDQTQKQRNWSTHKQERGSPETTSLSPRRYHRTDKLPFRALTYLQRTIPNERCLISDPGRQTLFCYRQFQRQEDQVYSNSPLIQKGSMSTVNFQERRWDDVPLEQQGEHIDDKPQPLAQEAKRTGDTLSQPKGGIHEKKRQFAIF